MIAYQLGATVRELFSLRLRAVLLILQVMVVAVTLAGSLHDALRSLNDLSVAQRFSGHKVTYFTIYFDSMKPFDLSEETHQQLVSTLDGSTADYSIVKYNYFEADHLSAPVLVALGGFAQAYQLSAAHGTVAVGANVPQYDVGDTVTLSGQQFTVSTRLPPGTAYLDPEMGYESLDEHLVLLSGYKEFAAMTAPDVWREEVVGRAVLFNPSAARIDAYIDAAASTSAVDVVPRQLDLRVAAVYEKELARSAMFLTFFGCLLLVLLGTTVATVDALLAANLRRYKIEMLHGAHAGHIVLRVNLFLAIAFSAPALCVFGSISLISFTLRPALPALLALTLIIHGALSVRALWTLKRADVTLLLRRQ